MFPTSVQSEDAVVEAVSLKRSTDNGDIRSRSDLGSGLQGAWTSILLPFLRLVCVIGRVARHRSTICRVSAGSLGLIYGSDAGLSPPPFSDIPNGAHGPARADGETSSVTKTQPYYVLIRKKIYHRSVLPSLIRILEWYLDRRFQMVVCQTDPSRIQLAQVARLKKSL